jgi:hypothetical protein
VHSIEKVVGKEVDEPEVGWEDGVAVSTTLTGILGGGGRRRLGDDEKETMAICRMGICS